MNYNYIFLALVLLIGCCSCDLDVVPDTIVEREVSFTAELLNPLDGGGCDIPCTVNLNNTSALGVTNFIWDFGDGSTSDERSPEPYTYTAYGTYIITLSAFAADGTLIDMQSTTINVIDPVADPIPLFIVENEGCFAPCVLTFDNTSTNAQSYIWDFGDGTDTVHTMSTAPLEHVYAKAGSYLVSLTAVNGDKTATSSQMVEVDIWTANGTFSAGSGKAIFQIEDHAYIMVGNTGITSGSPFIKRVYADENGDVISDATIEINIIINNVEVDMEVSDAALLSDGTIGIIGFAAPEAGAALRSLYLRVSTNGNIETPAHLLAENELEEWSLRPKNIIELSNSDNSLLIIGDASRDNPFKTQAFYQEFSPTLERIEDTQTISAGTDEHTYAGQITGNASNWAIGFTRQTADGNFQGELIITDHEGGLLNGFPRVLGSNFKFADAISMKDNDVFIAGVTQADHLYIAQTGLSSNSNINSNLLDFNAISNDLVYNPDINRFLLSTQQGNKGIFMTITDDLQIDKTSIAIGNSNNGFNATLSSRDCGFAACGFATNSQTLFFVKTDENGTIP